MLVAEVRGSSDRFGSIRSDRFAPKDEFVRFSRPARPSSARRGTDRANPSFGRSVDFPPPSVRTSMRALQQRYLLLAGRFPLLLSLRSSDRIGLSPVEWSDPERRSSRWWFGSIVLFHRAYVVHRMFYGPRWIVRSTDYETRRMQVLAGLKRLTMYLGLTLTPYRDHL